MYVPEHFAMDDAAVRDLLVHHGAGDLVTSTDQGLVSKRVLVGRVDVRALTKR